MVRPWLPPDYWWIYNTLRYDIGSAFETLQKLFIDEAESDLKKHEAKLWILGATDWAIIFVAALVVHFLLFKFFRKDLLEVVAVLRILPEDDIEQQKLFHLFNIDLENEEGSQGSEATV
ncbi:unnamed protein product [Vitrella brassicaformis CCMP3155]|uniref:Uncharacterized protein n=1 Tax=Vitrella brassicaformis (strain CCMP3155) TaxID=1169540 RepID=A0A0G4EA10_VITBC|nr:unnamed protein product [Vitrella brassicaformis CCMP3155]|mmetsp:Transcript_46134/g.114728  ORF Transcript_46134/g.114728 Transcript_46134/m.114728 type:complete len:119 (-) Transcript_46134:374-730(-)|eukprot:CEL92037.1 unnamed protein product [Vitrella brassicaformis CCMP3155]